MCKITPISVRLNLKDVIFIFCAVMELSRKVSQEVKEKSLIRMKQYRSQDGQT